MQEQIVKNSVVTLKYTVSDADGNLIDDGSTPLVYLHGGYGGIFERIEEALEGRTVGDQLKVRLQPEEAFGEYDEDLVLLEDVGQFPENISVGMAFERMADDGEEDDRVFRITDIADGKVVVDGNHPLAGVPLVFDITVSTVRAASPEEIEHGHVHGPHGHHH